MVRNPFKRRSGRATPSTSSAAVSEGPSTPLGSHSPRTLSSHALPALDTTSAIAEASTPDVSDAEPSRSGKGRGIFGIGKQGNSGGDAAYLAHAAAPLGVLPPGGLGPAVGSSSGGAAATSSSASRSKAAKEPLASSQQPSTTGVVMPGVAKTAADLSALKQGGAHEAGGSSTSAVDVSAPVGLDASRFTAPDQDGPSSSVLMPPGVTGGGLCAPAPPDGPVVSEISGAPYTVHNPVPKDLDTYMEQPGDYHATATPDKFHPAGGPLTPQEGAVSSLQQHYAFFDINKDGKITPFEMITGFRYLLGLPEPFNTLIATPVALGVQLPLVWLTGDSWFLDPTLTVHVKNAHKAVHGSNSKAWDRFGRFSPARFEALLSKYDKDGKGGLSLWEVLAMVKGQSNLGDVMGTFATTFEWLFTWWLMRDAKGVLRREDMRGTYDGTAFYRLAERNGYKHYGMDTARAPAIQKGYA